MMWKISTPHSYLAVNEYAYPLVVAAGCFVLVTTGAGFFGGSPFASRVAVVASRAPRNRETE